MTILSVLVMAPALFTLTFEQQYPIVTTLVVVIIGSAFTIPMAVLAVRTKNGAVGVSDIRPSLSLGLELVGNYVKKMIPWYYTIIMVLIDAAFMSSILFEAAKNKSGKLWAMYVTDPPSFVDINTDMRTLCFVLMLSQVLVIFERCSSIFRTYFFSYGIDNFSVQDALMTEARSLNRHIFHVPHVWPLAVLLILAGLSIVHPIIGLVGISIFLSVGINVLLALHMDLMGDETELKVKKLVLLKA